MLCSCSQVICISLSNLHGRNSGGSKESRFSCKTKYSISPLKEIIHFSSVISAISRKAFCNFSDKTTCSNADFIVKQEKTASKASFPVCIRFVSFFGKTALRNPFCTKQRRCGKICLHSRVKTCPLKRRLLKSQNRNEHPRYVQSLNHLLGTVRPPLKYA